jgi:DNA-binding NtrC family response regulator
MMENTAPDNHLKRALIVDDEKDTCYLLAMMLRREKYAASFVNSLAEASEALQQEVPEVIFLDNNLGDGTGVDYIPELVQKYPKLKVILITAFDTQQVRAKAIQNGAHFFLGKPFETQGIQAALAAVFEA